MAVTSWIVEHYYNQRVKTYLTLYGYQLWCNQWILPVTEGLRNVKQAHNIHNILKQSQKKCFYLKSWSL